MSLSWTKKHVKAVADVLDQDHDTLEDAARAALDAALSIIEERAKFAVVGQVRRTQEHGPIPPDHPEAVKVALGFFESDTKALDAGQKLAADNASGDELRWWVVPTYFGTPSGWHGERRKHYAELEAKAYEKNREKIRASIEKRAAEAEARAMEIRAMEEAAGGQHWPCLSTRIKAGGCKHEPKCK